MSELELARQWARERHIKMLPSGIEPAKVLLNALAAAEQRAAGLADRVAIYEAMLRVIEHDCGKCRADVQLAFAASAAVTPTTGESGER